MNLHHRRETRSVLPSLQVKITRRQAVAVNEHFQVNCASQPMRWLFTFVISTVYFCYCRRPWCSSSNVSTRHFVHSLAQCWPSWKCINFCAAWLRLWNGMATACVWPDPQHKWVVNISWSSLFKIYSEAQALASVPGASNKLGAWLSDLVRDFSPWASSAMEAAKETKFVTKVA